MSSQVTCTVRGMAHDRTDDTGAEAWVAATALLAAAALAAKSPKPDQRHFWIYWTVGFVVNAVVAAACIYGFIVCLQYWLHTTPCQRMGTC